jgi:hypothetical protein
MEWEAVELTREGQKPAPGGGMATRELARKEMAREVTRVRGKKKRDPRLQDLERAAEVWQGRKKGKEFKKRKKEGEKAGAPMKAVRIRGLKTEAEIEPQDSGIADWLQQGLARWMEQNQPEGKKGEGEKLNSATMAVLLRRAVAREKAMALGRKLPDPRAIVLEREAARWVESKEEALVS